MDVLLFQTPDGGEVRCVSGQMALTEGLDTAVYLSCFGGNSDDSGLTADDSLEWWGDKSETDPAKKYRSELQFLLRTLPLIPANLSRFEDAATKDLSWLLTSVADSLAVRASMPGIDQVSLAIAFVINGKTSVFSLKPPGPSS
jgi:phage gp46-like protein